MRIQKLGIPDRFFGQPLPVAPDMNQVVDKIDELVQAVNDGLSVSNAVIGGPKFVRYRSSQFYGVTPADLTLDSLDPDSILPGNEAVVLNPADNPTQQSAPPQRYVATLAAASDPGAISVPATTGSQDRVYITWQETDETSSDYTPLLASELNKDKAAYADLGLRPLLLKLVNALNTATSTTVLTPVNPAPSPAPTVTGFLPDTAAVGASVTLTGTNFLKATAVTFNGTTASFQPLNATTITAVVPVGATTGKVSVVSAAGTGTSTANFTVGAGSGGTSPAPELKAALALSLAQITLGASVGYSITASGGTAPYAYQVTATDVSTGQTYDLGTAKSGTWQPPAVDQYAIDATVTDSSSPAKVVEAATRYLNVVAAANRIPVADAGSDLTVPAGTTSAALMGKATDPDGDTIDKHAWRQVTGPNSATGMPTSTQNVVVSNLVSGVYQFGYRATDSRGGQSDEVYVMVTVQAASGATPAPTLTSFTPLTARVGELVTLTGTNFTALTHVRFGTVDATFTVVTSTTARATVPAASPATCQLTVESAGGTATSTQTFTLNTSAATATAITNLSPSQGAAGTQVTISGTKLGATAGSVAFNGLAATIVSWSDTQVVAQAPAGGTGYVDLTTSAGTPARSQQQFTVLESGAYDVTTAVFGEALAIEYRGGVESDNAYAGDIPALVAQGSSEVLTTEIWTAPFSPKIPHYGIEVGVQNAFNPGTGQHPAGVQDFLRAGYRYDTNGFIGFQWDAQDGSLYYYQIANDGTVTSIRQFGVPILPPFELSVSLGDRSATFWMRTYTDQSNVPVEAGGTHDFRAGVWEVFGHLILTDAPANFDPRVESFLNKVYEASIAVGSGGNAGKTFNLIGGRYGYLQGVGTANYAPVKYADGTPYGRDARQFIGGSTAVASAAPPRADVGIYSCFASTYDVDIAQGTMRQHHKLGFRTVLANGTTVIVGHNSIQWRYDAQSDTWFGLYGRWGTIVDSGAYRNPQGMGVSVVKVPGLANFPKGVQVLNGNPIQFPILSGAYAEDADVMYWQELYHAVFTTNLTTTTNGVTTVTFAVHYATTPNLPDENATWTLRASTARTTAVMEGNHFTVESGTLQIITTYAPGGNTNSKTWILDTGQAQAGTLTKVGEQIRQDLGAGPSPTHGNELPVRVEENGQVYTDYYWAAFDTETFDNAAYSWGRKLHLLKATKRRTGYAWPLLTLPS